MLKKLCFTKKKDFQCFFNYILTCNYIEVLHEQVERRIKVKVPG